MTSQCRFTYRYGCQVLFQSFCILVETCTTIPLETSQLWWCGKASHHLSDLKCQRWEFCFKFIGYWPADMWTLNFIHLCETALTHRRRFPCRKSWLLFYDMKNCHHLYLTITLLSELPSGSKKLQYFADTIQFFLWR